MKTVLLVDDDTAVLASLSLLLRQRGYRTVEARDAEEALSLFLAERPALVLQDLNFTRATTGEEGLALLERLREADPSVPVILLTAWGSIPLAVLGMKRGAADFLTKPWTNDGLARSVETALGLAESASAAPSPSRAALDEKADFSRIVGEDPALLRVLDVIARVSPTDAPVLILGESGTGKELVAEAIHRNGRRKGGPFVTVNVAAVPATLFESEMFGHVRGAFTDARRDRKGRFETADGGTLFLDEIGELDPGSQVKLLRVLQERSFEVLGSSRTRSVDVRVVSATNRPLPELAARGEFREDLLYRLNLITVTLPPLRDRRQDVPLLIRAFLREAAERHKVPVESISPKGIDRLRSYSWPGNIRQLRQAIERAVLLHGGTELPESAFFEIGEPPMGGAPEASAQTLDEVERAMILRALERFDGNLTRVAESLGLSRPALYRRLEKHGIRLP